MTFREAGDRFWALLFVVLLGQLSAVVLLVRSAGIVIPLTYGLAETARSIAVPLGIALALRIGVRLLRGEGLRGAASRELECWWEFPLIVLAYLLLAEAYMWGKVFVPAINPRSWDAALAALDRGLCRGVDPNVALLTLFEGAPRWAAYLMDRFYGAFVPSMLAATAWFSTGRPARRKGFFLAVSIVWSLGLWTYIALPARGPVYVRPDLWREVAAVFPRAAGMQAMLLQNFERVSGLMHGARAAVSPALGIAAMPSLHVAAQALFLFWCLRLRTRWRTVFLVTTGLTFLGSVATGWHWAVDGWAGIALAVLASVAGWKAVSALEDDEKNRRAVPPGTGVSPAFGWAHRTGRTP